VLNFEIYDFEISGVQIYCSCRRDTKSMPTVEMDFASSSDLDFGISVMGVDICHGFRMCNGFDLISA